MRLYKYILLIFIMAVFLSNTCYAETKNEKEIGLLLGDPVAVSINIPVRDTTFLSVKAGVWSWHFWEPPVAYDTLYLSVDYDWRFSFEKIPFSYYIGGGIAAFFSDSPKDNDDSDIELAFRVPVGIEFYKKGNITLGLEIAPVHQFEPWYVAEPYGFELNGGLILNYSF